MELLLLGICAPSIMLLASFLLCSLVSFLTGTAFGTAATMGVICRTMAKSMNVSDILAGGAILAGIYFGDRCSPVSGLPALCISGFQPDDIQISRLMGGGGILSNMKVIAIVGISSCYSGIFKGTDFLHGIKDLVGKLNSKITPFGTTLLTSVVTAAVSCNQTLSIMLTNQLCGENNPDKKEFALSLENSAVVVAPLIPWSIASAVPLAFIGAPTMSVCAAIYLYLLPIWYFISVNYRRKKK